ncbi:hypothetical protein J8273_8462 [Carpediemonas membranifera]|uniref:Uncharacterized protein n=1 Tax=Carpediemonas membranifera TaxID=201153 RepID=A0A8J6DXA7_9EUKA|nr:hypothetical protein J8273_8462 [Carpediemonas membranifera]|eukprot:KAG9389784.1 hypothetical protein J8273_8462 [Carpediemonas membranifera]
MTSIWYETVEGEQAYKALLAERFSRKQFDRHLSLAVIGSGCTTICDMLCCPFERPPNRGETIGMHQRVALFPLNGTESARVVLFDTGEWSLSRYKHLVGHISEAAATLLVLPLGHPSLTSHSRLVEAMGNLPGTLPTKPVVVIVTTTNDAPVTAGGLAEVMRDTPYVVAGPYGPRTAATVLWKALSLGK